MFAPLTPAGHKLYDLTVLTHLTKILSPDVKYRPSARIVDDARDEDWEPPRRKKRVTSEPPSDASPARTESRKTQALVLFDPRPQKKSRDDALALQLVQSQADQRLALVEHDREMDQMKARVAQMELQQRLALLEVEKRAADERATLLLSVNDKELALKQKEIDLLREKEHYLTERCQFLGTSRPEQPRSPLRVAETRPVEPLPQPMDPQRMLLHATLRPVQNAQGRFNLCVELDDYYDLRDVLLKVLTTNQAGAPLSDEDDALLRSGLLNDYRIFLASNNNAAAPVEVRQAQIFASDSHENRVNTANIMLHYAFVKKAREFNALTKLNKKTGEAETKHTVEVARELRHQYGRDTRELWFPKLTHGCDTIVNEALRFYAISHKSGPGDNKTCPFCCRNFANYSAGNIKNMHQLTGCDTLANLSQNERVALEIVLAHRAASVDFASHILITPYSDISLLRKATPKEVAERHYCKCKLTGDKVRFNQTVLMQLRADTWKEWQTRLNALSSSAKDLYHLNIQPFARMLDALGLERTRSPGKPATKKIVPPKAKPGQVTQHERLEAEQRDRIARCSNTLLGKILLNHRGENYLARLPVRSFVVDPATGFGDGMYFETLAEQQVRERRERVMAESPKHDAPSVLPFNFNFTPFPMMQPAPQPMYCAPPSMQGPPLVLPQLAQKSVRKAPQPVQQQQQQKQEQHDDKWSLQEATLNFGEPQEYNIFGQPTQHDALFGAPYQCEQFFTAQTDDVFGQQS